MQKFKQQLLYAFVAILLSVVPCIAQELELVVQTGHSSYKVPSIAFSQNGILASAGEDKTVRLWDVNKGIELKIFKGFTLEEIEFVTFSPDGNLLLCFDDEGDTKIWDIQKGTEVTRFEGLSDVDVKSIAFSPDGKFLAAGDWYELIVWEVETGKKIKTLENTDKRSFDCLVFLSDNKTIVTVEKWYQADIHRSKGKLALWDLSTGKKVKEFGVSDTVETIACSKDGKILASGNSDGSFNLFNTETLENIKNFSPHTKSITALTISHDNRFLISASGDNSIKVWDIKTGAKVRDLNSSDYISLSLAFSPDGKTLISSGEGTPSYPDLIRAWDVQTWNEQESLRGHSFEIRQIAFSPDGKTLVCGNRGFNSIALWDFSAGGELSSLSGHLYGTFAVAFSPDGKTIASGGYDGKVKLWDATFGNTIYPYEGHTNSVTSVSFSPDGKLIASASKFLDPFLSLWDTESGELYKSILINGTGINSISFSPDGRYLVASSSSLLKLFDVDSGKLIKEHKAFTDKFVFTLDSKKLIFHKFNSISVLDIESWTEIKTIENENDGWLTTLALSPDGNTLASGNSNGIITIYDLTKGKALYNMKGQHNNFVTTVAFSPDGRFLATGSEDASVKLWNVATGKEIATLIVIDDVEWVVIDPDGRFDASPNAMKMMHYVYGLEIITLEQIKDRYYEPGLLQKIINGKSFRLENVRPFTGSELYPTVEVQPLKQGQKTLTVNLKNRGGGIGAVQVFVNGKVFIEDARPKDFDSKQKEATLNIDLSKAVFISGEENKIEVFARNSAGWLRSRGSESLYISESEKRKDLPELYAVIGGVSDYAEDRLDLKFAAKDAEDFARALEIGAVKVFGKDKVHIRLLSSGAEQKDAILKGADSKQLNPTKENFKRAFEEFRKAKPTDIFVVYLSGHGTSIKLEGDTGDTYLYLMENAVTTDSTRLLDEKLRSDTAISSVELVGFLKEIHAGKQAMILDTCAAGAAENNLIAKKDITTEQTYQIRAIDRLKFLTGFYVLMGSAGNAQAYEATRYGQGLLTYALLEGMKGAGLENEYAYVDKIFKHAVKSVPDLAKGNGMIQEPRVFTPEQSQPFFIGRFTQEEQKQFTLASIKPVILSPIFLNKTKLRDDLNLNPLLKVAFINASFVSSRGRNEAKIIFVEADEMYDAIRPSGVYEINGNTITLKIVLSKNNDSVGESITVTGNINDKDALVKNIVEAVTQAAQKVEKER